MSTIRARQFVHDDFALFDLILAMDRQNLAELRRRAPAQYRERVRLFLEFAPELEAHDVPDPYYGGEAGFEEVLDLTEQAARGLLAHLASLVR
jgi:protein-tyrosine phosphatase